MVQLAYVKIGIDKIAKCSSIGAAVELAIYMVKFGTGGPDRIQDMAGRVLVSQEELDKHIAAVVEMEVKDAALGITHCEGHATGQPVALNEGAEAAKALDWTGFEKYMSQRGQTHHTYRVTKPPERQWPADGLLTSWCDNFGHNFGGTVTTSGNQAIVVVYVD